MDPLHSTLSVYQAHPKALFTFNVFTPSRGFGTGGDLMNPSIFLYPPNPLKYSLSSIHYYGGEFLI
jgi:hypothetical protein